MKKFYFSSPENFYSESLKVLKKSKIPFMVGGSFAVMAHTGIKRETKDLDIFCHPGDYPRILKIFSDLGYRTQTSDERWMVKIIKGKYFLDIIFNAANALAPVTKDWFENCKKAKIAGIEVRLLPPTELIWAKAFIQDRHKFDGGDVAHLILIKHREISWKRLLFYMDQFWEVLFAHILNFRFIYPSERNIIPLWVLNELIQRLDEQMKIAPSRMKICRGRLFSRGDYRIDIEQWGFADLIDHPNPLKSRFPDAKKSESQ